MRAFKESAGQPRYDPWERAYVAIPPISPANDEQIILGSLSYSNFENTNTLLCSEAWRYTGTFSRFNRFKGSLPGLGTATVAFAGYCLYEHFFMEDEHHGEAHH